MEFTVIHEDYNSAHIMRHCNMINDVQGEVQVGVLAQKTACEHIYVTRIKSTCGSLKYQDIKGMFVA